ncbi:DUF6607 family protein [Bradymonas sediminis]|uniref:Uncharacterized protein n=1 Tax=Bradymonas sediminis TaxID=1548548 RepID=A0A2Z4FR32_9DELT|nr:DUF6607 family protein [Bradymonas sediminis]AWV91078.1 hypothetical protein DN745_17770 [Bradymonas sediminis]TDP75180.1 hypothetical protein DFR33_10444 [Bradymonas sediminis]
MAAADFKTDDSAQQDRKSLERDLIKSMAGCYTVDFQFAETFAPRGDYAFRERYHESAREYVFVLEETDDMVSLQHLLRVGNPKFDGVPGKTTMIKHWRQDWVFENREFMSYVKDFEWEKLHLPEEVVRGIWTQKVYQVDDAPRYEALGRWVHQQGRHYWDGMTDAPLPRRDRTTRDDYNVLKRDCRVEVFADGSWEIDQDNRKIQRDDAGRDQLICMEKGLETFTPTDFERAPFDRWWKTQDKFWADVRACWAEARDARERLKFALIVDETLMYDAFFALAQRFSVADAYDREAALAGIRGILGRHLVD